MKILFLGNASPDYQQDCLFHGLRSLPGVTVTDYPRLDHMYKDYPDLGNLYGRGFTLFGLLDEDPAVDRLDIDCDLVIYGSIRRNIFRSIVPGAIAIDGEDDQLLDFPDQCSLRFKRELAAPTPGVHPIHFAIPSEKLSQGQFRKNLLLAPLNPYDRSTYTYTDESSYRADYQRSLFAITGKKAGWDCMRHYEIVANFCLPVFLDIESCPPSTLTNWRIPDLIDIRDAYESNPPDFWSTDEGRARWLSLYRRIRTHFVTHSTTIMLAQYVLETHRNHQP